MTDLAKFNSTDITLRTRSDVAPLSEDDKNMLAFCYNKEWQTPEYKMRQFIGGSQFTPYGKLKQYMVEAKAREGTVELLELEAQRYEIEMNMHLRNAEKTEDNLEAALHRVDAGKAEINWNRARKRCAEQYAERNIFLKLIKEFLDSPEGKTPDGRSLTEIIGTPEEADYEYHYWTVRMASQAAMDMTAYGRIGAGNLEAIQQMPQQQQVEVLGLANHMNLSLEVRQNNVRAEIGRLMDVNPPKQNHIGTITAEQMNSFLANDVKNLAKDLEKDDKEPNQGLNDVYNV